MFLAIYYAPTPDHAYDSVQFIENQVTFGWFVRGLHHWGASGMVIAVGLHMLQVFLYGAYKPPREMMWIVGVLLLSARPGLCVHRLSPAVGSDCLLGHAGRHQYGRHGASGR